MSQPVNVSTKRTSKKFKAILAGGLVLGVGAAVTLASWTDEEWASGLFKTGSFEIETSVDGDRFKNETHETEDETEDGAAKLQFDLTGANNMYPGQTVAAPFVMRLDKDTTYDADVKLTEAEASVAHPNFDSLTYRILQVGGVDECIQSAKDADPVSAGLNLNTIGEGLEFELKPGKEGAPGKSVTLCFQVTANDQLVQTDDPLTATWDFVGKSVVSE